MIYGRVIGNELRDVPPEYLPIWGQRWSGYRAPHGPSSFSTRIFSVDQMSEIGPALTSPTQFEVTLTEEDEGEDASSEPSRLYSSFPSSPLTIQMDAANLASPERLMSRSLHHSSSHPNCSPMMLHQTNRHSPRSLCATSFPRRKSEQSGIQQHAQELSLHPLTFHHGLPTQGSYASFEDDFTPWDVSRSSARIWPPHVTGQLPHTLLPHSISDWQFANAPTQSPTYQFHPTGGDYLSQQFQTDDLSKFITATPPPSSCCFTIPLPQQIAGVDSSFNHESNITMAPGIAHPRNHMVAQWPSAVSPIPSVSRPFKENPESSLGPGTLCHMVSDYYTNTSHPKDSYGSFAHVEGSTLLSLDKSGG